MSLAPYMKGSASNGFVLSATLLLLFRGNQLGLNHSKSYGVCVANLCVYAPTSSQTHTHRVHVYWLFINTLLKSGLKQGGWIGKNAEHKVKTLSVEFPLGLASILKPDLSHAVSNNNKFI